MNFEPVLNQTGSDPLILPAIFKSNTRTLAIDRPGTIHKENAIALRDGKLCVLIALPPEKIAELSQTKLLDFAQRIFSLSSAVPLRESKLLSMSELHENQTSRCLCIAISASDPSSFSLKIEEVNDLICLTSRSFPECEHYSTIAEALSVLTEKIGHLDLDKGHEVPGVQGQLRLLNNYAYHLVHNFLSKAGIPHIFHTSEDNFNKLSFGLGKQEPQITEKAPLGAPLRRVTCFINMLQLVHFIKNNSILFSGERITDLVANINELRGQKNSVDRKETISHTVACLRPGNFDVQSPDFKQREYLLIDHLAHSAPLPLDAWDILLHTAMPTAAKKQLMQQITDNPHYAYILLYELNKAAAIYGNKYKIEENVDHRSGQISLTIKVLQKGQPALGQKKTKLKPITISETEGDYFTKLYKLRLKAIQHIAGFFIKPETRQHFVPLSLASSTSNQQITDYINLHVKQALEEVGYTFKTVEIAVNNMVFFQLLIQHKSGNTYSYETTPIPADFKEASSIQKAEALNFLARKVVQYGCQFQDPRTCLVSSLPEDLRFSGLDLTMLRTKLQDNGKNLQILLTYKLRLLKCDKKDFRKTVALPFKNQYFLDQLKQFERKSRDEYAAAYQKLLLETCKPMIIEAKHEFLREVAAMLRLPLAKVALN